LNHNKYRNLSIISKHVKQNGVKMPIITHEDELILSKLEKELASKLKKLAKNQKNVVKVQKKLAENLSTMNISRQSLNRTMRDLLKQMQTLSREHASNVKDEDVKIFEDMVNENDVYVEANDKYINAIKDLAVKQDYLINLENEFAEALEEEANKRAAVIKKGLSVENAKNKMVEGDKLNQLDVELNDAQREFDRARDILLKKINQLNEVKTEINELWLKLKNSIKEMG